MTPKQTLIVQATFEQVLESLPNVTDRFYSRLFRKNESLKELFSSSRHKQVADFSRALIEIIHLLDKPEEMKSYIRALSKRHEQFNLTEDHYIEMGKAFVFAIRHSLGDSFDRNVANAWSAFFKIVGSHMVSKD